MQNKIQVDSSALFQKQKHHQKLEVEKQGCKVVKVLSVVNRLEGAKENLAKEGIELDSIFTRDDFDI